jgi:hypothetical protein
MPRTSVLLEKSVAACISAIEIYNKPDFRYREETFTILMINAWELLLKAKILKDNKNNIQSLYVKEPKRLANGQKSSKQQTVKTSRSGNPLTIEISRAIDVVEKTPGEVTPPLKENIMALCEIRDNAIHFKNDEPELGKIVLELGTASLKNYLNAVKRWFEKDLSKYNFYLMPMSFFHEFESVSSYSVSKPNVQLDKLITYLGTKTNTIKSNPEQDYNLLLKVETRFIKSTLEDTLMVKTVRNRAEAENPEQVQEILLTEEDITEKYPWSNEELRKRLKARYQAFKQDKKFNDLVKELKKDKVLCHTRLLNPKKASGPKTFFYNPNCIPSFFDKHYGTSPKAEG